MECPTADAIADDADWLMTSDYQEMEFCGISGLQIRIQIEFLRILQSGEQYPNDEADQTSACARGYAETRVAT